jgi:hypothetical protein
VSDKRCAVILGNGPSLDRMPPDLPCRLNQPDVFLIGTNRALVIRSCASLNFDALVIRDSHRQLWFDQRLGEAYNDRYWQRTSAWTVGANRLRCPRCDEYLRMRPGWQTRPRASETGDLIVTDAPSVVLQAVNRAMLRGLGHIRLLGVDYYGGHAQMLPPFNAPTRGSRGCPAAAFEHVAEQFAVAAGHLEADAGSLRNLSPCTALPTVDREDISAFLKGLDP